MRAGRRRPRGPAVRREVGAAGLDPGPRGRPPGSQRRGASQPCALGSHRRRDPDVLLVRAAQRRHRGGGDPAAGGAAHLVPRGGRRACRRPRPAHRRPVGGSGAHGPGPSRTRLGGPVVAGTRGDGARRRSRDRRHLRRPARRLPDRARGRHPRQARRRRRRAPRSSAVSPTASATLPAAPGPASPPPTVLRHPSSRPGSDSRTPWLGASLAGRSRSCLARQRLSGTARSPVAASPRTPARPPSPRRSGRTCRAHRTRCWRSPRCARCRR